jgi:membrane fusion protein (multidrug efflux system)
MARDFETDAAQSADTPADAPSGDAPARRRRSPLRFAPMLIGLGLVAFAADKGHAYWTDGRFMLSTDDAYISVDFAQLAPRVSGYVAHVDAVADGEVKAGDPLATLDDGDYRAALWLADADVNAQHAARLRLDRQIEAAGAAVAQAEARVSAAQAARMQAESDFARYDKLAASEIASGQKLDAARAAQLVAEAPVTEAEAGVAAARAHVAVVEAGRAEWGAALERAHAVRMRATRDLAATVIRAPFDGVVGNLSVSQGDFVTPGKRLMAVVPLTAVHVEANFKETQLADMTPGTPVRLTVDAFPDREVIGRVETIAPASGSVFSLLPPENATGNFTKVVQRVPVRISVPAEIAAQGWLRPGMSVVATLDVREAARLRDQAAR